MKDFSILPHYYFKQPSLPYEQAFLIPYGYTDRDMKNYAWNDSTSDSYYAGLYGTWISNDGWYVDAVSKFQRFDNDFSARDESGNTTNVGQFRAGVVTGRTIKLHGEHLLQPYLKAHCVEQTSSGGKVSTGDGVWRPNFDGTRAEFGGGIIWQINPTNQLHLDYEAVFTSKYDKPWGVTLGYRHQF